MKSRGDIRGCEGRTFRQRAYTLPEVLVAATLGAFIMAAITVGSVFTLRSFVNMFSYTDMDMKTSATLDRMSRDIREAYALISVTNTSSAKALVFSGVNESGGDVTVAYKWDSTSKKLVCSKTGEPDQTYLTGCNWWTFTLDQRTPGTNYGFYAITNGNLSQCKLVEMTWNCSRKTLGFADSETIQTAQIVLRN